MTRSPAKLAGPNPQPTAEEIHSFTQGEIDLIAEELGPKYGPAVGVRIRDGDAAVGVARGRVA